MEQDIDLSIIVPVYNVAPYVRHCLQSILDQGLENYEVIIVNDASHDNSRGICSEWCLEHPEFHLINHEVNRGLSEARNTGLGLVRGRYVTFVDSDDYLQSRTLAVCMQSIDKADVVEYPIMVNHLARDAAQWTPDETDMTFAQWMRHDGFQHCYACNKVFRRDLWDGIRFPEGRCYEDILTIPKVLGRASTIRGIRQGLYYYCYRYGSISTTPSTENLRDYALALATLMSMPEGKDNLNLYLRALNAQLSYTRSGGKDELVPRRQIPWGYLFSPGLTMRQRMKALWFKIIL